MRLLDVDKYIKNSSYYDGLLHRSKNKSGSFRRMQHNIYAEAHLDEECWNIILDNLSLLNNDGENNKENLDRTVDNLVESFRQILKRSKEKLSGIEAKVATHTIYANIKTKESFLSNLGYGFNCSDESAEFFFKKLIEWPADEWLKNWLEYDLSEHHMWATFDGDDFESKPFYPLDIVAKKSVFCSLGLPDHDGGMIITYYKMPNGQDVYVPTICEAYAGGYKDIYFVCSEEGAKWGSTMTRTDCDHLPVQNEIVHKPIKIKYLKNIEKSIIER